MFTFFPQIAKSASIPNVFSNPCKAVMLKYSSSTIITSLHLHYFSKRDVSNNIWLLSKLLSLLAGLRTFQLYIFTKLYYSPESLLSDGTASNKASLSVFWNWQKYCYIYVFFLLFLKLVSRTFFNYQEFFFMNLLLSYFLYNIGLKNAPCFWTTDYVLSSDSA